MASRAIPTTALSRTDLLGCTDPRAVYDLFRRLRYPVEPQAVAVALDEGDLPASLQEGVAARYLVAQVGGAKPGERAMLGGGKCGKGRGEAANVE